MNMIAHGCLMMCLAGQIDGTSEGLPTIPVIGQTYTETAKFECGTEQTGLYYELVNTHGPFTAPSDNMGQYCESWTGGAGTVQKYNLACTLLHALFSLNANWSAETITISTGECESCCTGPSCSLPLKHIHAVYSYSQKGWVKKSRRLRWTVLGYTEVTGWAVTNPCESAYCLKKERNNQFSCSQDNKGGTYVAALRNGAPAGCCP